VQAKSRVGVMDRYRDGVADGVSPFGSVSIASCTTRTIQHIGKKGTVQQALGAGPAVENSQGEQRAAETRINWLISYQSGVTFRRYGR